MPFLNTNLNLNFGYLKYFISGDFFFSYKIAIFRSFKKIISIPFFSVSFS
jgi:hypothetical protein